jgi:hypothetical protein
MLLANPMTAPRGAGGNIATTNRFLISIKKSIAGDG